MIHVCYGLYDRDGRYSKFVGTSITSLFENTTSAVTVHILHDNTLSEENRDKFNYVAGRYSQTIKFYNVEKLFPDKIDELREKFGAVEKTTLSLGTLYRLLIPHVFPESFSKIIYFDADTIINLDIKEFWQIDLKEKILGAVPEAETDPFYHHQRLEIKDNFLIKENLVNHEDYLNAGVLLLNLNGLRNENKLIDEGIKFASQNDTAFWDQDVLNYCFSKNYLKLPIKFNNFVINQRTISSDITQKQIYHYASSHALQMNLEDNFNKLWFEYFAKTPWFDAKICGNFYESLRQVYVEQKNFAIQVSKFVAGKKRVFFVAPNYIEAVKNIFGVENNEKIFSATAPDSLKKLIKFTMGGGGTKYLFILTDNYGEVHSILEKNGFIPGKDFINAWMFLSDAQGFPLNTHFVVKNL